MKLIIIILISIFFISCASDELSDPTPKDKLIYPVSVLTSKDNSKLFVANSNFDLRYRGASIVVIDLDTQSILPTETKLLDSFLADMEMDENEDILFTISKDSSKLYAYDMSESSPYLSCNKDVSLISKECDANYMLQLSFDTPSAISLDKNRKLIYISHKSDASVSIVKYEKINNVLSLRLLKSFTVEELTGNASDIEYNESLDRVFVASDYTRYIISFKPLIDYYGNINKINYFPTIKITNRALLLTNYSSVEDISFFEDKMFLSLSTPSSISVLSKQEKLGETTFSFEKSIYTDSYPVKVFCTDEAICLTSLYKSRKLALLDFNKELLLSNIDIKKRGYDIAYSSVRKEIYVTLFIDNAILVLDLDSESPTFLKIKNLIY